MINLLIKGATETPARSKFKDNLHETVPNSTDIITIVVVNSHFC